MKIASAWHDERQVYLVQVDGERRILRKAPARWSVFLNRPPRGFRGQVERLPEVERTSLVDGGRNLRMDCPTAGARRVVRDALAEEYGRDRVLEGDVDPVARYLADHQDVQIAASLKIVYVDVEAQEPDKSIQDATAGDVRVLAWTAQGDDGRLAGSVLEVAEDQAEIEHLLALVEFLRGYDVIVGWYLGGVRSGSGFDADVIRNRFSVLGIEPPVPWRRWCWFDLLEIWRNLTQGDGAEKSSNKLGDVAPRLLGEDVGKLDFDASETWAVWNSGPEGRRRVLAYCARDTELLPMIAEETGFVDLFMALCRICRILPNTWSLQATAQGDGYLLGLGARRGYRWKTRWRQQGDEQVYDGAVVLEPTRRGVIEDVHVCDFTGLYTSIMDTLNMSPETRIGWEDSHVPSCVLPDPAMQVRFRTDRVGMIVEAIRSFRDQRGIYKSEMKGHQPGTPEYKRLWALSNAMKIVGNAMYGIMGSPFSRFYDRALAHGIANTAAWLLMKVVEWARERGFDVFYGDTDSIFVAMLAELANGLPSTARSRVLCALVAGRTVEDVAAECSAEELVAWGFQDPVDMVQRFSGWAAAVVRWCEFVAWVNEQWTDIFRDLGVVGDVIVELDYEKAYSRLLLVKKKRYAGRHSLYKGRAPASGTPPEVRGMEVRRGDSLPLAREMQQELLGMILGDGVGELPELPVAEEASRWIDGWRIRLLSHPLTLANVTISQGIKKPVDAYFHTPFTTKDCKQCGDVIGVGTDKDGPDACPGCRAPRPRRRPGPHAQVARLLADMGIVVRPGDRVRWMAVLGDDKNSWRAVPARAENMGEIDIGYYWGRMLRPVLGMTQVMYPEESWKHYEKQPLELRREGFSRLRVLDNTDLPLFKNVTEVAPVEAVVVHLGPACTEETVDFVAACAQRSRGGCSLVLKFGADLGDGDAQVTFETQDAWRVDPRLLATSSRRLRRDVDGVFHVLSIDSS